MAAIPIAAPESLGIEPAALRRADELVQRWLTEDRIPAAGWCVGRRGRMIEPRLVGRQRPPGHPIQSIYPGRGCGGGGVAACNYTHWPSARF